MNLKTKAIVGGTALTLTSGVEKFLKLMVVQHQS